MSVHGPRRIINISVNPALGREIARMPQLGRTPDLLRGMHPQIVGRQTLFCNSSNLAAAAATLRDILFYAPGSGNFTETPMGWNGPSGWMKRTLGFSFSGVNLKTMRDWFNYYPGLQPGKYYDWDSNTIMSSSTIENGTPYAAWRRTLTQAAEMMERSDGSLGGIETLLHHPYFRKLVPYIRSMGWRSGVSEDEQLGSAVRLLLGGSLAYTNEDLAIAQQETEYGALETQDWKRYNTAMQLFWDVKLKLVMKDIIDGRIRGNQPVFFTDKEVFEAMLASTWYFWPLAERERWKAPVYYLLSLGHLVPYPVDQPIFLPLFAADFAARGAMYSLARLNSGIGLWWSFVKGPSKDLAFIGPAWKGIDKLFAEDWQYGQFMISGEAAGAGISPSYKKTVRFMRAASMMALLTGAFSAATSMDLTSMTSQIGPIINIAWGSYMLGLLNKAVGLHKEFEKGLDEDETREKFSLSPAVEGEALLATLMRWRGEAYSSLQGVGKDTDLKAGIASLCEEIDYGILLQASELASRREDDEAVSLANRLRAARILYELYETSGSRSAAVAAMESFREVHFEESDRNILDREIAAQREHIKANWPPEKREHPVRRKNDMELFSEAVNELERKTGFAPMARSGEIVSKPKVFWERDRAVRFFMKLENLIERLGTEGSTIDLPMNELINFYESLNKLIDILQDNSHRTELPRAAKRIREESEYLLSRIECSIRDAIAPAFQAAERQLEELRAFASGLKSAPDRYGIIMSNEAGQNELRKRQGDAERSIKDLIGASSGMRTNSLARLLGIVDSYEDILFSVYPDGATTRENVKSSFRDPIVSRLFGVISERALMGEDISGDIAAISGLTDDRRLNLLASLSAGDPNAAEASFREVAANCKPLNDSHLKAVWQLLDAYRQNNNLDPEIAINLISEARRRTKAALSKAGLRPMKSDPDKKELKAGEVGKLLDALEVYNENGALDDLITVVSNRIGSVPNEEVEQVLSNMISAVPETEGQEVDEILSFAEILSLTAAYKGSRIIAVEKEHHNTTINQLRSGTNKFRPTADPEKVKAHREALISTAGEIDAAFVRPVREQMEKRFARLIERTDEAADLMAIAGMLNGMKMVELLEKVAEKLK